MSEFDPRDLNVELPGAPATDPAPDLDAFQAQANQNPSASDGQTDTKPPVELKPIDTKKLLENIAKYSSVGLPKSAKKGYQEAIAENDMLEVALDMIGLPELLAKYGSSAGGVAQQMPDWVRLIAGVGIIGYFVASARRDYATPYTKTEKDPVSDSRGSSDIGLDQLALGDASNFPST
ncbi:hypothetical protein [Deinococcus misasensis]|uniref:hypothetical protein n=1 Tax=Deinococcus misasensis TaxID=392413 RepID=UPI00055739C2|nr:hypothetical protein [Deinococcus misasensis]